MFSEIKQIAERMLLDAVVLAWVARTEMSGYIRSNWETLSAGGTGAKAG